MTYKEAIAWLYATQPVGIKLGLENITRLVRALGIDPAPAHGPVIFHIAGTNGKGSVCAMLDAICRAAGKRTALFTSPHLVTFRERIRVNGAPIPEADIAAGLTRIREIVSGWPAHPTFFELTTALALAWFQEQRAEVIVLETGLGGRLDATNALTPAVTAITSLSMDHRQYLGETLAAIAAEKAGIFKPGVPAVSTPQPPEAARVLEETAARVGASFAWAAEPVTREVALAGSHQRLNAALALAILEAARMPIPQAAITQGLQSVIWPGRFQRIAGPTGIPLILDGAHNESAASRLVQTWAEVYGEERPVLLLGVLRDKDVPAICRELAPLAAEFVVTPVHSIRTCDAPALAQCVRAAAPATPCLEVRSAAEGLQRAQAAAQASGRRVLITGSLFLVGEVLALLQGGTAEASAQ
ncbi:MAG: bifunctional folylpolyglutamate synthase/dihydrofolate synthase [Chthoniobacteraceae bacterium]|nr:bifunctional folylpolyglutamate synthase/dihydrofolate synthase [Chthoniobacteraceae bacterium]